MTIDEALEQIEDISRSENPYEYGLPTHDEESTSKIRMAIKQYVAQETAKLDKELDIVHDCLTDLYNDDSVTESHIVRIKQCLGEIEKL